MKHQGLTRKEVDQSRKKYGLNILPEKRGFFIVQIILNQFKSPLIYIVLITAIISLVLNEFTDAFLMFSVIVLNSVMGFFQEYRSQKIFQVLKNILKPEALVIREGKIQKIQSSEVVVNDIAILNPGDKVPADGKLIESVNLLINEAILTGESEAVLKNLTRSGNHVFMGSTVLSGHGLMRVNQIGRKTEIGKISESISIIKEEKTPLQKKLERFSTNLAYIILLAAFLIFIVGLFFHYDFWYMLKISIILTVAAIPEGLPIAVTVILSLGMKKILDKRGLVKKLIAMETLGTTTIICTDKTGTLTEGNMKVVKTDFKNAKSFYLGLAITNEQKNNVEVAIWNYLQSKKLNPDKVYAEKQTTFEEPFDSEKKYKLIVAKLNSHHLAYILGAPEIILSMCQITEKEKKKILKKLENWASKGLRVIGLIGKEKGILRTRRDFRWIGLIGIEDPIRKEAKETIQIAQKAGIKVKIITGDYRTTAEKIAVKLGFKLKDKNILEGEELEKISDHELKERIENIYLFTRVAPRQKLRIVNVLQEKGEVVAMTGDGVNDAPALKKADIGIVVGDATEVAKETADLILLNNNFTTIVSACEEGRRIFANIKKVVAYVLSNSFVEMFLIFGAILFKLPAPLTLAQILWIHLICDGPLDIVLGFESKRKALENENPQKLKKEEILNNYMKILIFIISFFIGIIALIIFKEFLIRTTDLALAQTITFAIVASVDIFYIFAFKDLNTPIFSIQKFWKNKFLLWAVGLSLLILLIGIYLPIFNKILGTEPLKLIYWLIIIGTGLLSTIWVEIIKFISNKKRS